VQCALCTVCSSLCSVHLPHGGGDMGVATMTMSLLRCQSPTHHLVEACLMLLAEFLQWSGLLCCRSDDLQPLHAMSIVHTTTISGHFMKIFFSFQHTRIHRRVFSDSVLYKLMVYLLIYYVAAKATYIRLLHGKIGFLGVFRP